ncbi:MAG TPA: hypothetical protein VMT20_10875 [Terriglobia bacterium]|nr:hypothetical protein [Terriglobia bacterium]
MKNVEHARLVTRLQLRTLNARFRGWLAHFAAPGSVRDYDALMRRLHHVKAGRRFTRDEMNER